MRGRQAFLGGAAALGVIALAASGAGQVGEADATRVFDVSFDSRTTPTDLFVDLAGYVPPPDGARMVYLDGQGVLGRGTLRDVTEGPDCDYCGGMRGGARLLLDAAPTREPVVEWEHHTRPLVVGPLDDGTPDPAIVLETDEDLGGWSIDLDGDGRGDLARTHLLRGCPGPARRIEGGMSPCDLMSRAVCDAQVRRGRHAHNWRPIERVERPYCLMDGRRDFEF